jgi:hypothetical protein
MFFTIGVIAVPLDDRVAGGGIAAEMGEKPSGHCQLPARHCDGTVMEVDAEGVVHGVVEHTEGFHVIGEGGVAKTGPLLRSRHFLVNHDRGVVIGEPHEAENLTQHLARLMSGQDDVGDRDRAGIDEGVSRNAVLVFELDDRVKWTAGGLATNPTPQSVADFAQRQS